MHDMVGRQGDHHRPRQLLAQDERGETVGVGRAARRGFEDEVGVVYLGEDGLDDLALSYLAEHEDLVGYRPGPVIGGAHQMTPMGTKLEGVFGRLLARARPEPRARTAGE